MSATAGYKLFTPLALGEGLTLKNRIALAPLTRGRSDPVTRVPTEINEIYYEQRSGAGLIITEATAVSDQGHGWYAAPALYNEEQAAGWKKVVDRVHAKDSKIFLQLWHMGRQGHSSFSAKGELVSASAIKMPGDGMTKNNKGEAVPYETPRALRTDEIAGVVEDYRKSAELAKAAGFDGVEIHGANGYLVDQFLQSISNTRTDQYGGSFENRARLLLEIVDAVKSVWPADRIGVRLGPNGHFGGMGSPDNAEFFTYVFEKLSVHGLAYLALLDGFGFGYHDVCRHLTVFDAKKHFKGTVLANNSYTRDIAEGAVRSGAADFVSFGRPYIGTPDLAERFEQDVPLNPDAPYTAYWDSSKGPVGYIDFPFYNKA
ncbi:12-oxophytodienoate reductase [Globisporangium polare]